MNHTPVILLAVIVQIAVLVAFFNAAGDIKTIRILLEEFAKRERKEKRNESI